MLSKRLKANVSPQENWIVTTGDDCVAAKGNTTNMVVRNVTCYGGAGMTNVDIDVGPILDIWTGAGMLFVGSIPFVLIVKPFGIFILFLFRLWLLYPRTE